MAVIWWMPEDLNMKCSFAFQIAQETRLFQRGKSGLLKCKPQGRSRLFSFHKA